MAGRGDSPNCIFCTVFRSETSIVWLHPVTPDEDSKGVDPASPPGSLYHRGGEGGGRWGGEGEGGFATTAASW